VGSDPLLEATLVGAGVVALLTLAAAATLLHRGASSDSAVVALRLSAVVAVVAVALAVALTAWVQGH